MFCGCELSLRRGAQHAHLPGLPRPARARCRWPTRRRSHYALMIGPGARLRDRAALDLPPQELLLSGPARRATRSPSTTSRSAAGGRLGDVRIHRVAPRGGRGQARPRRRVRAHPRRRRVGRRLQPRRHAAGRDRHRARHPLGRAGARVADAAARDAAPARRLRREHGGGLAALRRQRLDPPGRRATELGTKTELKNMNSFRFLERGHRRRDRAPDALAGGGGAGRAGDAALRPATRRAHARCAPRRRRTTTATSRSPTSCRSRRRRRCSRPRARRCPSCPRQRAERYERELGLPADTARLLAFRAELGDYFEQALAADGEHPQALANWVTASCVARLGDADPATRSHRGSRTRPDLRRRTEQGVRLHVGVLTGRLGSSALRVQSARRVRTRRPQAHHASCLHGRVDWLDWPRQLVQRPLAARRQMIYDLYHLSHLATVDCARGDHEGSAIRAALSLCTWRDQRGASRCLVRACLLRRNWRSSLASAGLPPSGHWRSWLRMA